MPGLVPGCTDRRRPRLHPRPGHDPWRLLLRPDRLRPDRQCGQGPLHLAVLNPFLCHYVGSSQRTGCSCVCFAVLCWRLFFVYCPWPSVAAERWPSSLAEPLTESSNARRLRAQRRLARMLRRVRSTARVPKSRLRPRRMALGKARQAPLQQRKVPAMPAREAKAAAGDGDGGRRRRRSIPASTHALPATASSPSQASMVIASRRRERLRQFRRAASMAWSERPPTATARRTQNCWAGTVCTTPRRVTAGSRRTQILKLVPVPRKSLLARCARTD